MVDVCICGYFWYNASRKSSKPQRGGPSLSAEAAYKKEIQDRKKAYQNKKVALISQLCAQEDKEKRKQKIASK